MTTTARTSLLSRFLSAILSRLSRLTRALASPSVRSFGAMG
ncbi:hypothetical protein AB4Y64_10790 [Lysobacter sp. TAF61]